MVRKTEINDKLVRFGWWALAILVFLLVIAIRIRLLQMPLERDEGEYAYAGQLMLQAVPPYKLAYNMKFPGTYAAYAAIMSIFGQTVAGIHLGLLLVNAATIALIFFLGRRLMNSTAGIAAAASYGVLSVSPSVLGLAGHATHFVMLPIIGGVLLLVREADRPSLGTVCMSGLLFGVGLLMKQPAIFFGCFGALCLISWGIRRRLSPKTLLLRIFMFAASAIIPFAIVCLLLWHASVFDNFWFWTINYAREYGGIVSLGSAPQIFVQSATEVIATSWPLWVLAGVGILMGLCTEGTRASTLFLLGLLAISGIAVSAGFYFRYHYFIMLLPAVSLFIGIAISILSDFAARYGTALRLAPLLLFGVALSAPILANRNVFFQLSPVEACRIIYPESPFQESVRIAEYVRENTSPDDTIAVVGSEPQIYFYSRRHSATGYIYTYGLMEPQKYAAQMQQNMIQEIESARPKFLISVVINDSWLQRPESDRRIFNWANDYATRNYTPAGFVNMTPARTDYFFGDVPQSVETLKNYILIYKRKL